MLARHEVLRRETAQGCSLMSMEPLRQWSCKGADVTSPAEYEAALQMLENNPQDIRDLNDNVREERWNNFSLESIKLLPFPWTLSREEALANFERERVLIIYFQMSSKAAALYAKAWVGLA